VLSDLLCFLICCAFLSAAPGRLVHSRAIHPKRTDSRGRGDHESRASTLGESGRLVLTDIESKGYDMKRLIRRLKTDVRGDEGTATAEYAIATMAAVGFAGLLVVIMRSEEVRGILLDLVHRALTFAG
jgi:Protein of unknown function (DUF4244)